jgi:hypothetical protein
VSVARAAARLGTHFHGADRKSTSETDSAAAKYDDLKGRLQSTLPTDLLSDVACRIGGGGRSGVGTAAALVADCPSSFRTSLTGR